MIDFSLFSDKWQKHHLKCGRHSGFKDCCILFWIYLQDVSQEMFDKYRKVQDKVEKERGIIFQYRPCPSCLVNEMPIKLIDCDCYKAYREKHGITTVKK